MVDEDGGGGVEVGNIGSEGWLVEGGKGWEEFDEGRSGGEGRGREGSASESRDNVGGEAAHAGVDNVESLGVREVVDGGEEGLMDCPRGGGVAGWKCGGVPDSSVPTGGACA